ncbi:MAG: hypothetical protein ACREIW_07740, partial [Chthoniobacterales bacterium]
MTFICVWSPDLAGWPLEQLASAVLKVAPRLAINREKGQIWVDGKSLPIEYLCDEIKTVLGHQGALSIQIGASRVPVTAEVAARVSG